MSFFVKIIRIVGLYVAAFFACIVIAAITIDGELGDFHVIAILLAPIAFVWWYEKRKAEKQRHVVHDVFPPKMETIEETTSYIKSDQSKQDIAPLMEVGRKARPALEEAATRRLSEKEARLSEAKTSSAGRRSRGQGWTPIGETVRIAGREIDGMVYVGVPPKVGQSYYREPCRAYIDPALSVAKFGKDVSGMQMPYWPGYSTIPAVCRATYLDWLSGGRSDASINPGYMFLFFYGLERRFLLDDPADSEKQAIIAEVQRLKNLFTHSRSTQRYLGEFLDLASIATMRGVSTDDEKLKASILENRSWDIPVALKVVIGTLIANDSPIDADWMYLWLVCHPETRLRIPAKRCGEEFQALFKMRFDKQYPEGLKVRKPKRKLGLQYRAASGEFTGNFSPSSGESGDLSVPDISDLLAPVHKAQDIAEEATEDLDKFSRYLGRNPDGRGSIEALALLPAELWPLFPSEELDALKDWVAEQVAAGGKVPAIALISRLEGSEPEKLSKRLLTDAADALARIGFGMAPDPRFSLRGPKLDEPVILFKLGESVDRLENVSASFQAELLQIALASLIAHADGEIVEAERRALREKVETAKGLTELEGRRLSANLDWYLSVPPDLSWLRSKLKNAEAEHYLAIRAVLVSAAHADGVIQPEEVALIEKVYKTLGMDADLVYADLHAGVAPDGPVRVKEAEAEAPGERVPDEPRTKAASLDAARIAAIRNDTKRVSSVLGEIFSTEDEVPDASIETRAPLSTMAGLDEGYARFVERLIQREHWTDEEFEEIAGKHGLMPSGALETINEWAFEKFDEALLDEYDGYDVSPEIADALKAEMAGGD